MRRRNKVGLSIVAIAVAAFVVLLMVMSQTDFGRERARRQVVRILSENSHGIIRIRSVSGNLLSQITLEGVSVTDSSGNVLFLADTVATDYGFRALTGRRIEFDHVRLIRPIVVIEKRPGERWNFERIFPRDTVTREGVKKTGWGTWIRFTDVMVEDGRLITRVPWEPDSELTEAERDAEITRALGVDRRMYIVRVPGGLQRVHDFREIDATLPLVRLADPAYRFSQINVAALRTVAFPFRPPGLTVKALTGTFQFTADSLWWNGMRGEFLESRFAGSGRYTMDSGDLSLRLRGSPASPADVRWVFPQLPRTGTGSLDFSLDWIEDSARYVASNADIRTAGAHIMGDLGVTAHDGVLIHRGTALRFTGLYTSLLETVFKIELPRAGTLAGHAAFSGRTDALDVDGDVVFAGRSGRNRVVADGTMGFSGGEFSASGLRVRMLPVTVDLARVVIPEIPFGGQFTGTLTLNGSTANRIVATGDVTHVESGRRSRAVGTVGVRPGPRTWVDVNARVAPLALATAGQFAPALGLRGFVTGPVRMTGTLRDFVINTQLAASGGGTISINGRLALGGRSAGYDLALDADLFDASAVSSRAPSTSLTAVARARGTGTDPETMRGMIVADVRTSSFDTVGVDSAKVRVAIAGGIARFDTLAVHVPQGELQAMGTLGMSERRSGELRYRVRIDSLSALAGLMGADTGVRYPRPAILTRRAEIARADSARVARVTEVERAVTGRAPPTLQLDTPTVVRRNVLSGSLAAEGVASGSIRRLGLRGTATGQDIVARGHTVSRFAANYDLVNIGRGDARMKFDASATDARLFGFQFDSVTAGVDHARPRGSIRLAVRQDNRRDYAMNADYTLHADHREVHLNEMTLQFDTTRWASTRPSEIRWGRRGVEIDSLELRTADARRVFVDGFIPSGRPADLRISVDRFELGDLVALVQSDVDARGLVTLDAQVRGTAEDPTLSGTFSATDFAYNGTVLPRVAGTLSYDNQTLTGRAEATRDDGSRLVVAEGTVPVNLALRGVTGSRIPRDRTIALRVQADSFPIGIFPQLTRFVSNVSGRTSGSISIGGTLDRPALSGNVTIVDGGARIVPLGIRVNAIAGSIRMTGDTAVIDSLAGNSGGGPVRLAGGLGVGSFREPAFDLRLVSTGARLLDNHLGRLEADVQLALYGPFAGARLSGGVRLREGVLYMPEPDDKSVIGVDDPALFAVLDTAVASNKELFPAQSPLLANLAVDVRLGVNRDVFVRSKDANIEVYSDGDLVISADAVKEALTLDGILLSDRGDYVFLTKRFKIKRGSATFVGLTEINPTLQVTGEYEVRQPAREEIVIQIIIGGTLLQPKITLRSDAQPPISQTDLLSYLAFGRKSSSLTALEGSSLTGGSASGSFLGQGAALAVKQIASVALGVFTDEIAGEAARSLGADVFIISPAEVQTDVGNFLRSTEFEFGKYVRPTTFIALQARPDPSALRRPGFQLEHRFPGLRGYQFRLTLEPRYVLRDPSLAEREPQTRSVFGAFIVREWRY